MKHKYFAYESDFGFETFETDELAREAAEGAIDRYREDADDGWDDNVANVCWGVIAQQADLHIEKITDQDRIDLDIAETNITEFWDYQLKPIIQKTDEYGGFNTLAEQVGDLVKVIFEANIEVSGLLATFSFSHCTGKWVTVSMTYRGENLLSAMELDKISNNQVFDIYHFIALAIDAVK